MYFCIGLFLSAYPLANAQIGNIAFEHFTYEDGLSAPVTRIVQDSFGFIWLGTMDGLNRFDGRNFTVYRHNPKDTFTLNNNIINDLCVDPGNRVWAATNSGLCYFDFADGAFHSVTFDNTLEKIDRHRVHALANAKGGGIWFATKTQLHLWKNNTPVATYHLPATRDFSIKWIYDDEEDLVWLGTSFGIFVFNTKTSTFIYKEVKSPFSVERKLSVTVHPILPLNGDTMLIGSWYGGLQKVYLEGDSVICIPLEDQVETNPTKHVIRTLSKSKSGQWWIGSYGNGLSLFDPVTSAFTSHFHHNPSDAKSLSDEYVSDLFTDASGILWIGTAKGLDKFDPLTQQFKSIAIPSATGEFSIYRLPGSILEDRDDSSSIWLTVSGAGVFHFNTDSRKFKLYQHENNNPLSLPDNSVHIIFEDDQGRKWIGMRTGMCLFDPMTEKFTPFAFPNNINPQGVHQIIQDKEKNLWFASFPSGVYCYKEATNEMVVYNHDDADSNSIQDNRVFCIMEDHAGYIWIGTQNRGLSRLDPTTGKFTFFEHVKNDNTTIPDNGVYDLYEDENEHLWIATENGLAEMDLKDYSIKTYTTFDGLCNNDIFSITPDLHGYYWLATNNGLSKFDPRNKIFKNYFINDGLPTNSITGATHLNSEGTLFFGTSGMISYCKPAKMSLNKRAPPVILTNFSIFDHRVPVMRDGDMLEPIRLSYQENMITFEFAALNFTNSNLNQYAYKLEGFDDKWIYCGSNQSATFTNLDGGTYIFRVKAANNDGTWNEEGTHVTLIVQPPYWKTWWFYLLCTIGIGSILYLLYRFRINQLLRLQQIRLRISRDLHDDIGSTLSSINMISSMATRTMPEEKKASDLFQTISSASRQAMELMSDIVWSINPKNDRMEMIMIRMRQYASEILEAAQISFNLTMDEECHNISLSIEDRKDFYLIFKEAINNVAKYSKARHAVINIHYKNRMLTLQVTDDGIGFDTEEKYQGNGLKNMKARATQLNGTISITSKREEGASLLLTIPVTP